MYTTHRISERTLEQIFGLLEDVNSNRQRLFARLSFVTIKLTLMLSPDENAFGQEKLMWFLGPIVEQNASKFS
jgi:hypothetical protein